MPFSSSLPEWNKTATAPTTTKKNAGWSAGEKPPASIFDWFFNTTYKALQELQQEAVNVDQKGAVNGIAPLDATGKVSSGYLPLSDSITDTSTSKAATANSVKLAVDWAKGFGLGTNGKTTADCNTAILSGFYYVNPGAINSPSPNAGSLIVSGGNGFLSQMFVEFSTGDFYFRRQYSDTWNPWKTVATKEYVDAAPQWINLTLQNGAVEYSAGSAPQYTKIGHTVYIRGAAKNITAAATIVGTLPSDYRPTTMASAFALPTTNTNGARFARWQISTDGTIRMDSVTGNSSSAADWFPMDMCFIVD